MYDIRALGRSYSPGVGALCVEIGYDWTFPRIQDVTVKLKSELVLAFFRHPFDLGSIRYFKNKQNLIKMSSDIYFNDVS